MYIMYIMSWSSGNIKVAHQTLDWLINPRCGKVLTAACKLNKHIKSIHMKMKLSKLEALTRQCLLGVGADMPENSFFSEFFPDTCIYLYFWILRGVSFLELFYLGPPSFAKMHIYVYIADLHGEVKQNILNGQKNMLKRWTFDFNAIHHLNIPILLL